MQTTKTTAEKWDESTIANRQHVIESAGFEIDAAKSLSRFRWSLQPPELQAAVERHGFDALCDYGFGA